MVGEASPGQDSSVFTKRIWKGDPDGDMALELEGCSWKVRKDIVSAQFPWIQNALATAVPVSKTPSSLRLHAPTGLTANFPKGSRVIIRPRTSNKTRPKVFSALLQFAHTGGKPTHYPRPAQPLLPFTQLTRIFTL